MSARILPFRGGEKPQCEPEILGGLYPLSLKLRDEPETSWLALLWTAADGFVLGHSLIRDVDFQTAMDPESDGRHDLAHSLEKAREAFARRSGHPPGSLALNRDDLAAFVGSLDLDLELVEGDCGPVDEAGAALAEHLTGPKLDTWFSGGATEEHLDCFFRFMGHFRAMKPWEKIPSGCELVSVEAPALELPRGVAWVLAPDSGHPTVQIFDSLIEWRLHVRLSTEAALDPDEDLPELPPCLGVSLSPAEDSPPALYAEAVEHGWIEEGDPLPIPLRTVGTVHARLPLPHEYELLAIACSGIATYADRVLRQIQPMATHTQGMFVELDLPRGPTEIDLGAPAPELFGCTDGGMLGFGPTIAELIEDYLEMRRDTVGPATVRRDEAVLRDYLRYVDWDFLNWIEEGNATSLAPPTEIHGGESIGLHLASYLISEYLGRSGESGRNPSPEALREAVTSFRQFLRHLRGDEIILPDMVEQLLEDLLGPRAQLEESLRSYLGLSEALRLDAAHTESDADRPRVESELFEIRRLERDRLWLVQVSPDGQRAPTVKGPVVLKGADLTRLPLERGWGVEGVLGRGKTGGQKRRFRFLTLDRVVPPGLMP